MNESIEQVRESVEAGWRARLQYALAQPRAGNWPLSDDPPARADQERAAGVLIPVVATASPYLYFTQRSDSLPHHAGQISFPGGSVEAADSGPRAAALREAHEEIGLDPAHVDILGELAPYRTVTGFVVSPFVGWIDPLARVTPDPGEVARLFSVPITHALEPQHFRRHRIHWHGHPRDIYAIDYAGDRIWGATAGMLFGLLWQMARAEGRPIDKPPEAEPDTLF